MDNRLTRIKGTLVDLVLLFIFSLPFLIIILPMVRSCFQGSNEVVIERVVHDTTFVTKVDTLILEKVKYVTKRIVDTVYVGSDGKDSVGIPIYQYRFQQNGIYDIVARGYEVSLDKVEIYPKTVTKYVTATVEQTRYIKTWDVYGGGGIASYGGRIFPMVGVSVKTPDRWMFSADVGYCGGDFMALATARYRIGNKQRF